jgi:predicted O-methyltransferase YrrM
VRNSVPRLTPRRLVFGALAVTPLGIAVLTGAVLLGWLTAMDAVLLAFATATIAGLGLAVLLLRRVDRRTLAESRARTVQVDAIRGHLRDGVTQIGKLAQEVSGALADVRGAIGEDRMELLIRLDQVAGRLGELEERLQHAAAGITDLPGRLEKQFTRAANAAASAFSDDVYTKVESHAGLHALITPRAPMPSLSGWALAADTLHAVATRLWDSRPELVVECGSGSSSVWLGYLLERLGVGQIVSLEHDQRYLEASRALVRAHGLEKIVEIRHAPLETWTDSAGVDYQWYASRAFEDLANIGLLLVDGPPGSTGHQARYPAGPLLFPRCREDAVVVLDDIKRPAERTVTDRWLVEWPGLTKVAFGKRTADVFILGRRDPSAEGGQ